MYQNNCPTYYSSSTCIELYNNISSTIGVYDSDNLYMNFCSGNGTLDFTATHKNCYSIDDLLEWYLNVILLFF